MSIASLFSRYQSWVFKGGFSILDQGLFSGANFIISILFARWLTLSDYGVFVIAFTFYLLLTGFYTSFILEPMSVFGPAKYSEQPSDYFYIQLKLHGATSTILALIAILTGWYMVILKNRPLGDAFIGVGIALPFLLLLWLVRREFYILKQPAVASLTSGSYFISSIIGAIVLHSTKSLNAFTGFLLLGTASVIASFFLLWKKSDWENKKGLPGLTWRGLAKEQWFYGQWIAAATVLSFLSNQIQVFFLAGLINIQASGALDALQNFTAPIAQGIVAIATLALPILSYDFGLLKFSSIRKNAATLAALLTVAAGIYELLIWGFSSQLETFLYGGKYASFSHLIPILRLIPFFTAFSTGYSLILKAIQKPEFNLVYEMVVAPIGLITGVIFIHFWGLAGAVWSLVIISLLTVIILMILYKRWFVDSLINKKDAYESN